MNATESVTPAIAAVDTSARSGTAIRARVHWSVRQWRRVLYAGIAPLAIVAAITAISVLHYVTAIHSIVLHEIFKRLYYVPIVVAAVSYGMKGGVATSIFASLLYLPHVMMHWHGWPVSLTEQYGEITLFNIVAASTGALADRLRAERNRYRQAATELQEAYGYLKAQVEERLRIDRLVTLGRVASGMAHEIRNPLGGVLGCLEILESDFPCSHPKREFFTLARREVRRLDGVVTEFLDFAQPVPPTSRAIDLNALVDSVARLVRPSLVERGGTIRLQPAPVAVIGAGDAEQVQRAVLNVVLTGTSELGGGHIDITVAQTQDRPSIVMSVRGAIGDLAIADVFDPFPSSWRGHGLALATARRLIENQHGCLEAERIAEGVRFVLTLPAVSPLETGSRGGEA